MNVLKKEYSPDVFNIGANCGKATGQTVFHLHFHIISRYLGDHMDVAGWIRRIFSDNPCEL